MGVWRCMCEWGVSGCVCVCDQKKKANYTKVDPLLSPALSSTVYLCVCVCIIPVMRLIQIPLQISPLLTLFPLSLTLTLTLSLSLLLDLIYRTLF